jgi:hypothetical protein
VSQGDPSAQGSGQPISWDLLVPVALSLLGGAAYATLRARYVSFYSDFGTTPDDVGLGYLQVLAGSVWAIALTFSFGASVVLCLGWRYRSRRRDWLTWHSQMSQHLREQQRVYDAQDKLDEEKGSLGEFVPATEAASLERLEQRRQELKEQQDALDRERAHLYRADPGRVPRLLLVLLSISTLCFLATIAWIAWTVPHDLDKARESIKAGRSVGPRDMVVLAIQADRARVTWIGTGRPPPELTPSSLLFLGHADGVASLYNSSMGRGLRVPERHVVIVISP